MIFIILGSQKFQFNRLLQEVDRLISTDKIAGSLVFAQTGFSDYKPRSFDFKPFLNTEEFDGKIAESKIVITHGGTGSIISGLKKHKKLIVVPRSTHYGEHVDNHQFEIAQQFEQAALLCAIADVTELENALKVVEEAEFKQYVSNTPAFIKTIEAYIEKMEHRDPIK